MSDEQLRMQAVVVDRASGPLQKIARQIQTVGGQRMDRLEGQMTRVEHSMKPVAREVMNTVSAFGVLTGVTGGAAVALGGAALAMSNFAKSTVGLRDFAGSVRMSMQGVAQFEAVAKRFNIDPDAARGGLKAFAHNLYEMRHRIGDLRKYLDDGLGDRGKFSAGLLRLSRDGDIGKALEHALDLTEKVYKHDPVAGEKLSKQLFGTPDLARIKDYVNERSKIGPIVERDVKASEEFLEQQRKMILEADRLKTNLGIALMPVVTDLVKEINTISFNPLVKDVGIFARELRALVVDINKLRNGDWSPIMPKIIEGKDADGKDIEGDIFNLKERWGKAGDIARSGWGALGRRINGDPDTIRAKLADIDRQMQAAERGSSAYARLEAQREKFARALQTLEDSLRRLEQQSDATAKTMSWTGGDGGGPLLHNASLGGGGLPAAVRNFRMGGFRGGSMSIGGNGPSNALAARSPDGVKLDNPLVKQPSGAGAQASSGAAASGNQLLDAIARAEGTSGKKQSAEYNTVLGYGQYGRPDKPLTDMTLAEAFRFGRTVRARHGSSSAIGRYQIVGNTMKLAAKGLGLDWENTRFDEATQDRMAKWIARKQGLGAWEGFKHNPRELSIARQQMHAGAAAELAEARRTMDRAAAQRIEGTGKISVDVTAPRGTRVNAQGGGIFQQVEIQRSMQMPQGEQGPLDPMPLGY